MADELVVNVGGQDVCVRLSEGMEPTVLIGLDLRPLRPDMIVSREEIIWVEAHRSPAR